MNTPPIVSQQEWEVACQQLPVKEKALTRSREARSSGVGKHFAPGWADAAQLRRRTSRSISSQFPVFDKSELTAETPISDRCLAKSNWFRFGQF